MEYASGLASLLRDGTFALYDSVAASISLVEPSARADTMSLGPITQVPQRWLAPDRTRITGNNIGDSMFVYRVGEPGRAFIGRGLAPRLLDAFTVMYRALDGPLMAGRLNADGTEFVAPPIALTEAITLSPNGQPIFDVASDGTLIYGSGGGDASASRMVWVGRDGREEPLRDGEARPYQSVRISPDGRRIVLSLGRAVGSGDVWVQDLADVQAWVAAASP